MDNRFYVLKIQVNSNGSEERSLTPYDDETTAKRKYHEAFNTIGAGPKLISVEVLDRWLNVIPNYRDTWQEQEPEPEPNEG